MTNNPSTGAPTGLTAGKFPEFPPRDDMQNYIHLNRPGHAAALDRHFGTSNSTAVLSEAPVRWRPDQEQGHRIPDLLVAFNVDRASIIEHRGYSVGEQGKPPDFVLEIASETTGQTGYTEKRDDYAGYQIPEYWRFDPSGGRYHDAPLAGDRLVDGAYQPIRIVRVDEAHHWGHSDVLDLDLCWEEGRLRWWDPAARRYLPTFDEVDDERIIAAGLAGIEQRSRIQAEARADTEQTTRIQAEARANSAEARVRELEEELRRLRES